MQAHKKVMEFFYWDGTESNQFEENLDFEYSIPFHLFRSFPLFLSNMFSV